MRHKQSATNKKHSIDWTENRTLSISRETLGMREVYPAEEFAGFEVFGESPEWHPGQAACAVDFVSCAEVEIITG